MQQTKHLINSDETWLAPICLISFNKLTGKSLLTGLSASSVYFLQSSQNYSVKLKVRSCHSSTQNSPIAFISFRIKSEVNMIWKDARGLGSLCFSNLISYTFSWIHTSWDTCFIVVLYRPARLSTSQPLPWLIPSLAHSDEEATSQKTVSTILSKISTG